MTLLFFRKLLKIDEPCKPISVPKVKKAIEKKAELNEIFKRTKELLFKSVDDVTEAPQIED